MKKCAKVTMWVLLAIYIIVLKTGMVFASQQGLAVMPDDIAIGETTGFLNADNVNYELKYPEKIMVYSDNMAALGKVTDNLVKNNIISFETGVKINDYLIEAKQRKISEAENISNMDSKQLKEYFDNRREVFIQENNNILNNMVSENVLTQHEADDIRNAVLISSMNMLKNTFQTKFDQLVNDNLISKNKAQLMMDYMVENYSEIDSHGDNQQFLGEIHFQQKVGGGALYYEQKPNGNAVFFEATPGQGVIYYEQSDFNGEKQVKMSDKEIFDQMVEAGILTPDEMNAIETH